MSEPIESAVWKVLDELTIEHARLRPLIERLERDFDADAGGYRQLRALKDEEQRAVVSDQIGQSARAIRDNLAEARLHQRQLDELVGPDGVKYPEQATHESTILRGAQMDMAITGFARALGSALDCLAAAAIGILRMPFSIQRASFSDLPKILVERKRFDRGEPKQQEAWTGLVAIIDAHRAMPPDGWLEWLNGMRNLNVHRARQVHILLQRLRDSDQPQMIVFDADPIAVTKKVARFDLHLRRRPGLPDMQDFISTSQPTELWINERATTTLPGMLLSVNTLVEEVAHFLLAWWEYSGKWPMKFPPPDDRWTLESPPWPSFDGFAPAAAAFPLDTGVVGPQMGERLRLAERLRQARDRRAAT